MPEADPLLRQIYLRHIRYRPFLPGEVASAVSGDEQELSHFAAAIVRMGEILGGD